MNAQEVAQEIERLSSAKARVLAELRAHPEGCTNHYLRSPHIGGARAMGRVNELIHEDGHDIEVTRERGATWRVRLRMRPSLPLVQPPLLPRRTRPRRTAQARLF